MSSLNNELILENLWDEVCDEFPTLSPEDREKITYQRFEDMCQQVTSSFLLSPRLSITHTTPNAMTNEQFKLQNEAMEVLEMLEDTVEYVCREQQICGEKVWYMVHELARIKCNQFPNYEEEV